MLDAYDTAYRAASAYCWEVQTGILDDLKGAVDSKEVTTTEELYDRLHENIDGSATCIYTGQSMCYNLGSRNDGAVEEELGDRERYTPGQRAYFAIRADILDRPEWDELVERLENAEEVPE
jgi:hypothetical protein